MPRIQTFIETLEIHNCPECGISYAAPESFFSRKQANNGEWYCPNGHSVVFRKSDLTRAQEQLATAKKSEEFYREWAAANRREADTAERRRRATKAVLTKTKKRLGEGKCPKCSKQFPDLGAHISDQHPGYVEPPTDQHVAKAKA